MRKKSILGMLLLTALVLFSGCSKEEIPIEDYVRSNPSTGGMNSIMKSDTGYYYCVANRRPLNLHYFDMESGQNIFLCSKPECRHDGDAFCTATSEKYTVRGACYYGGSLYINAVEETDNEYLCKLLKVSPDGTELTEVVTYQTINKTSLWVSDPEPMLIHRGVAVIPYLLKSHTEDIFINGICFYDLITGEQNLLPEYKLEGTGNGFKGYGRLSACGDYVYYTVQPERKYSLHRYSLTNKTEETIDLENRFTGMYEVIDENTLYFYWSGSNLFEYHIAEKETITHSKFFENMVIKGSAGATSSWDMMTDGTYLFLGEGVHFRRLDTGFLGTLVSDDGTELDVPSYVHVYDRELNKVATVEIATENYMEESVRFAISMLDGIVYLKTQQKVFRCTLEEFLANEIPPFQPLYDHLDIEF